MSKLQIECVYNKKVVKNACLVTGIYAKDSISETTEYARMVLVSTPHYH